MKFRFFAKKAKDRSSYQIEQAASSLSSEGASAITESVHEISKAKNFHLKKESRLNISAALLSALLGSIGYGIIAALIAFRLEKNVGDEVLIAISAATAILSGVFFAKYLNSLSRKFGIVGSIYFAGISGFLCCILFYFYISYGLWLILTFFFGSALFVLSVARQFIAIEIAPQKFKALVISSTSMVAAIGNGIGPIILNFIKTGESFLSFFIAGSLFLLALMPISRLKKIKHDIKKEKKIQIWHYVKSSPKIMMAGFTFNYCYAAICAFLIIYGLKVGLNQEKAAMLYSILLFGTIFSIPIGYLTDKINRRFVMISGAIISLFLVLFLYFSHSYENLYIPLFLMFGSLIAMKLPAVVLINEKYKKTQRLAVNTAFMKFSIYGNLIGIFLTGFFMKYFDSEGLWLSMAFALFAFLLFCAANYLLLALKLIKI